MVIHELDEAILRACYAAAESAALRIPMIVLTCVGSGWTTLALLPLFFRSRTRAFAASFASVLVVAAGATHAIKLVIARLRPCVAFPDVPARWGSPTDYSFPSGHATGAFTVAAFVSVWLATGRARGWRGTSAAFFVIAAGVAASRVFLGVHYPSDVLGAAALGSLIGAGGAWIARRLWWSGPSRRSA